MNFKLTTQNTILIIFIIALIVFFIIASRFSWFKPRVKGKIDTSDPAKGNLETDQSGKVSTKYERIAENARQRLYGWNATNSDMESVTSDLLALNDNELGQVVNEYERMYRNEDYPTLRDLISAEWNFCTGYYIYTIGLYYPTACSQRDEVLNRLNQIGA